MSKEYNKPAQRPAHAPPYSSPYPMPHHPPPDYYPPPPYIMQSYLPPALPANIVDEMMPRVPFYYRPMALKLAIVLIILGVIFCMGFVGLILPGFFYSIIILILVILFFSIGLLGIISIILLMIPKRIGWYLALITACIGIIGLGPGTIISIFTIIALFWPSTQYFFRTGQPMPPTIFYYSN